MHFGTDKPFLATHSESVHFIKRALKTKLEGKMDFQQAQAGFQWLDGQMKAGAITQEQYQSGLNELRVTDPWGRLWMQQERTGIWHCYSDGTWVAAQPPVLPAAAPPAVPAYPRQQAAPAAYAPTSMGARAQAPVSGGVKKELSLFMKYVRMLLIWLGIWVVIAAAFYLFYARLQPQGNLMMAGIGVAAVLSLVLMLWSLRGSWKGQVTEIRIVKEQQGDDDGSYSVDVRYAFIRQVTGRMRKERAMPDWQPGDWLEKRLGENWVRKMK
jgi:hypothetical protein